MFLSHALCGEVRSSGLWGRSRSRGLGSLVRAVVSLLMLPRGSLSEQGGSPTRRPGPNQPL